MLSDHATSNQAIPDSKRLREMAWPFLWGSVKHLVSFAGVITLVPVIAPGFSSRIRDLLPIYPDTWSGTFLLALAVGLLVSSYRLFVDNRSEIAKLKNDIRLSENLINELENLSSEKPQPKLGVEVKNSKDIEKIQAILSHIPEFDMENVRTHLIARAKARYKNASEKYPSSSLPSYAIGRGAVLKPQEDFARDLAIYLAEVDNYVSDYRHFLFVTRNFAEVSLRVSNIGEYPASNVVISIEIPPTCRVATELEEDWIRGEQLESPPREPDTTELRMYLPRLGERYQYRSAEAEDYDVADGLLVSQRDGAQIVRFSLGPISAWDVRDDLQKFYLIYIDVTKQHTPLQLSLTATELKSPVNIAIGEITAEDCSNPDFQAELLAELTNR